LLTNFSQGYHSKRLLDAPVVFPAKLGRRSPSWR
jgi:hypothetical protein